MERETTFENAKVGDRVYSPLFKSIGSFDKTNATIQDISNDTFLPIIVKTDVDILNYSLFTFTKSGGYITGGGQALFWENPITKIPVMPKRMVKKTGYTKIIPCKPNDCYPGRIAVLPREVYADATEFIPSGDDSQIVKIEWEEEE